MDKSLTQWVETYSTAMKCAERYGNTHGDIDAANHAWHKCKEFQDKIAELEAQLAENQKRYIRQLAESKLAQAKLLEQLTELKKAEPVAFLFRTDTHIECSLRGELCPASVLHVSAELKEQLPWKKYVPVYLAAPVVQQKAEPIGFVPENKPEVSQAALKAVFRDRPDYFEPVVQQKAEPIGEMREGGVTWFGPNPHAFSIGTKFYAEPVVPDGMVMVPREPSLNLLELFIGHGLMAGELGVHHELYAKAKRLYENWVAAAQEEV